MTSEKNRTCMNCRFWFEISQSGTGVCEKLLNCWQIKFETGSTTDGQYNVEHIYNPVEYVYTDEWFGCNLWKKDYNKDERLRFKSPRRKN